LDGAAGGTGGGIDRHRERHLGLAGELLSTASAGHRLEYPWQWRVFLLVFSLFPTGRFVPSLTRWLVPCWVVSGVVFLFSREVFFSSLVHTLVWLVVVIVLVIVLFYRYHFACSPLQRQQTKWVIFGSCVAVGQETMQPAHISLWFRPLRHDDECDSLFNNG
jgi:hypothetical protein